MMSPVEDVRHRKLIKHKKNHLIQSSKIYKWMNIIHQHHYVRTKPFLGVSCFFILSCPTLPDISWHTFLSWTELGRSPGARTSAWNSIKGWLFRTTNRTADWEHPLVFAKLDLAEGLLIVATCGCRNSSTPWGSGELFLDISMSVPKKPVKIYIHMPKNQQLLAWLRGWEKKLF